jgi:hypothetical protein
MNFHVLHFQGSLKKDTSANHFAKSHQEIMEQNKRPLEIK